MECLSFDKVNVIIACCEDIYGRHCIKKVTMIASTHKLSLSSLIQKVVHFPVLSRINKLDRDLLYWKKNYHCLVCPLRNHMTSLLSASVLKRVQRRLASWIRCIFEPNWYVRGYIFYGLTRMLMSKNVNKDVTINSPIPGIYSKREIPVPLQGHRWLYSAFINFLDVLRGLNCL